MSEKGCCPHCGALYLHEINVPFIDYLKNHINEFSDEDKLEIKNILDDSMKDQDTFIFTDRNEKVNNRTLKDEKGNLITKRDYYDIQKFINGYAIVVISNNSCSSNPDDYCYGVIDKEGEEIIEPGSEGTYGSEGLHYIITEIDNLRKQYNADDLSTGSQKRIKRTN